MGQQTDDEALVLRSVPFGEADLVVTLLTAQHGRIGAFARSARKSTKRFAGGIGPFSLLQVSWVPRAEGLCSLTSSDVIRRWTGLTDLLVRTVAAALVVEVIEHGLEEGQGDETLFDRVARFFDWLATQTAAERIEAGVCRFVMALMDDAGIGIDLTCSSRSQVDAESLHAPMLVFGGGLVDASERHVGETGVGLSRASLDWLRTIQSGRFPAADRETSREGRVALLAYAQGTTGRELRTLGFYREVVDPLA
jgi:DNA repair protein RecO (recombination protein O)